MRAVGPIKLPLLLSDGSTSAFTLTLFNGEGRNYHVLQKGDVRGHAGVLLRVESACSFAHVYGSRLCDCQRQMEKALLAIAGENSGLLIYALDEHGRGVGLENHVRVYMAEQQGLDTVDAHASLGLPVDARDYRPVAAIIDHLAIKSVRLLTNNPRRVEGIRSVGILVEEVLPLDAGVDLWSARELMVKKERMGHRLSFSSDLEWANHLLAARGNQSCPRKGIQTYEGVLLVGDFRTLLLQYWDEPGRRWGDVEDVIRSWANCQAFSLYWAPGLLEKSQTIRDFAKLIGPFADKLRWVVVQDRPADALLTTVRQWAPPLLAELKLVSVGKLGRKRPLANGI